MLGIVWLGLAIAPLALIFAVTREVRSRLRVRQEVVKHKAAGPAALLESLLALREPTEVAIFLEQLRVQRGEQARALPQGFVRGLVRLIESTRRGNGTDTAVEPTDPALRLAIANKTLSATTLTSWNDEVLDELGRLDEFLRER